MRFFRSTHGAAEDLTFQWKDPDRGSLRLWFFLIVSLAAHGGCFYLFQVVYPKSERALPYTAALTVLDPMDPVAREAMERVADRVAGIDVALRIEAPGTRFEDFAVTFAPSFRDHRLEAKEAPSLYPPPAIPDLFDAGAPSLPPLSVSDRETPSARRLNAPEFVRLPHVTVRGDPLERRNLRDPIDWSATAARFAEVEEAFVSFLIAVDAQGRVRHSLLSDGDDTGLSGILERRVRAMRFVPDEAQGPEGLQWGWIDIRW